MVAPTQAMMTSKHDLIAYENNETMIVGLLAVGSVHDDEVCTRVATGPNEHAWLADTPGEQVVLPCCRGRPRSGPVKSVECFVDPCDPLEARRWTSESNVNRARRQHQLVFRNMN